MSTNEEITEWLNQQHEWIQEAARRLLEQGTLEQSDIDDFVNLIKTSSSAGSGSRSYPKIGRVASSGHDLRLESIGPVIGIDALNPRNPLAFGDGNLTVIYGMNGSGKSGYTRIISRACGKPHSVDLRPNVYEGASTKQECTFSYKTGGAPVTTVWTANSDPIEDLKSVDVFDTECGRIYLEKETELSYEPPELKLFYELVRTCQQADAQLAAEQAKLVSALPVIPAQHAETAAGKSYAALTKDLTESQIQMLVTWTEGDTTALNELRNRLSIRDLAGAAKKRRDEKEQIDQTRSALQEGVDTLGSERLDALRALKKAAVTKRTTAEEGAKAMGNASLLDGVGSKTWKAMWEAARLYSTTEGYPESAFPYTEDAARCVLCHQDLDAAARERLKEFEDFVKGALETEAVEAERQWKEALGALPVRPAEEAIKTACQAAGISADVQAAIESGWQILEKLLSTVRSGAIPDTPPAIDPEISELLGSLQELSNQAEATAKELDDLNEDPNRVKDNSKVVELEGKKWVTEQASAVRAEVDRLKKTAEYDEWKRQTSTTGISRKAGTLSEKLITEAYVQRFNDELRKLGDRKLQVELVKTPTRHGRSKHRIQLRAAAVDGAGPAEVLSEGERRIVALAAFLADVMSKEARSPFVFDDPISSLDQDFEESVIARLVELSQERQVLVFTHRLSFLSMINGLAGGDLTDVHIRRDSRGTGQPGEVPLFGNRPEKALNRLKNERLHKAKNCFNDGDYEEYQTAAKSICGDFRILMERFVEHVLLGEVVLRFRRSVQTMNRIENLAKISSADCELIDEMMTKYSFHEHSQPEETPIDVPEPDEIEKDIDRVIDWHNEFKQRPAA